MSSVQNKQFPQKEKLSKEEYQQIWRNFTEKVYEKGMNALPEIVKKYGGTTLRQVSQNNFTACCPFHVEKTPSFVVSNKGFYCFGAACGEKGNVFQFLQKKLNVSFVEARDIVAQEVGETPPDFSGFAFDKSKYIRPVKMEPRVVDPAEEYLASPERLGPHDLTVVDAKMPRPDPGRRFAIYRPESVENERKAGIRYYNAEMVHQYKNVNDELLMIIMRLRMKDGSKIFLPLRSLPATDETPRGLTYGGQSWHVKNSGNNNRRPVYGAQDVRAWVNNPNRGPIVVVEGEKCRDYARRTISDENVLILSASGGYNSNILADWKEITDVMAEKNVIPEQFIIWPDADPVREFKDGTTRNTQAFYASCISSAFFRDLQKSFQSKDAAKSVKYERVVPPDGVDKGWDIADATEEGWTEEQIMAYINSKTVEVDMSHMTNRKNDNEVEVSGAGASPEKPFFPESWGEELSVSDVDMDDMLVNEDEISETSDSVPFSDDDVKDFSDAWEDEVLVPEDVDDDIDDFQNEWNNDRLEMIMSNKYFRCLGYFEGDLVFMNLRSAFIQHVKVKDIGNKICLSLAPLPFWAKIAPKKQSEKDRSGGINWDEIADLMFRATEKSGIWNSRKQVEQGVKIDSGRVVFHSGDRTWVENQGIMRPGDVIGEYCYTSRIGSVMPDMEGAYPENADEVYDLLDIVKSLAWREDIRRISEMTMFGFLSISAICGVLKWRPHVWLDGSRGVGKTWITQNLINPILKGHSEMVKSNSTESGLRNLLHARAIPVIFDEAEGSSQRDKARMEEIISLARHTSSETDAVVAQGVAGGGGSRRYAISSMFFLASIGIKIDKPSDHTRFARISLGPGLKGRDFMDRVEKPSMRLLTQEFSDKFIGRMIRRAKDAEKVINVMTLALMEQGMERRIADVYGVFAGGAWLALRDGVPADEQEGVNFIVNEFGALEQIKAINEELAGDKDHDRLINTILASNRKIETANGPVINETIGMLLRIAAGERDHDSIVNHADALRELNNIGIRPSQGDTPCEHDEAVTHFLIYKKSQVIRQILEKTPYETGYGDILRQAPGVVMGKAVRFRGAHPDRALVIPKHVLLGEAEAPAQ